MDTILTNLSLVLLAIVLVLINGFFVAAEFALVKTRPTKIDSFVAQKRSFAKIVRSQLRKLDAALSACQLGITLASLGLGWIGEPALAKLIRPILNAIGINSSVVLHATAFTLAFAAITALHLTVGEQVPKMYAVKNPEKVALWCALPLKIFYILFYPFLIALNASSNFMLRKVGVKDVSEHGESHTEEEIRALLAQAHSHGDLSRTEHRLLDAVFEFDDRIAREVMIPRRDIVFLQDGKPIREYLNLIARHKHTRYPFCENSLDDVQGIVHIKDLIGVEGKENFQIRSVLRPPHRVPEGMQIGKLLRHFQSTKQHMALVVDEFGNIIGAITLENVLEEIVGAVQDEFDQEEPRIVPAEKNTYIVDGAIATNVLVRAIGVAIPDGEAETLSGLITETLGRLPQDGDKVDLCEVRAEVMETQDGCAKRIKIVVKNPTESGEHV